MKKNQINKLVEDLKNGSEEAFDLLYEEFKNLVFYCVMTILKDRHLSEEVTQDAFIRMYQNIDKFKSGTNFKAWLVRIAKNLAINEYNKRKLEVEYNENIVLDKTDVDYKTFEFIDSLQQFLTPDECDVIVLRFVYDLKNREIAEALDKPLGTVLWLYQEAIKKLKNNYERGNNK